MHEMNGEICFPLCCEVVGDSFKLPIQSFVVLNRSSSLINYCKLPYIVFLNVLFFDNFVFLQEQKTAGKVGIVPCLRQC